MDIFLSFSLVAYFWTDEVNDSDFVSDEIESISESVSERWNDPS